MVLATFCYCLSSPVHSIVNTTGTHHRKGPYLLFIFSFFSVLPLNLALLCHQARPFNAALLHHQALLNSTNSTLLLRRPAVPRHAPLLHVRSPFFFSFLQDVLNVKSENTGFYCIFIASLFRPSLNPFL